MNGVETIMTDEEDFTGYAREYDQVIPHVIAHADRFFEAVLAAIPRDAARILELGSGTGYFTRKMLERFPHARVTCIDRSEAMVAVARAKPGLAGVLWMTGDFRETWPEGTFDAVVSTLCLHHIPDDDRRALFIRAMDSLRPNGRFVNGDVFRGGTPEEEAGWRDGFYHHMVSSGLSEKVAAGMVAGRERTFPLLTTHELQAGMMEAAGFSGVSIPYRFELYGVVTGSR
jgi:SAM-dependent methyltransferase